MLTHDNIFFIKFFLSNLNYTNPHDKIFYKNFFLLHKNAK